MQFQKAILDAVLDGRKTVTRRRGKAPYVVGRTYIATDRSRFARSGVGRRSPQG